MIKHFDCILFDADETLFEFDAYRGLKKMFAQYGVSFSGDDYQDYQALNRPLWEAYQRHEIDAEQLKIQRFDLWAQKINVPASTLNEQFLIAMADICQPLPGAKALLQAMVPHVKMGIITNGFTDLLHARLASTGLAHYFQVLTISEQFGLAKPAAAIFHHTLSQFPGCSPERTLMIGDTPESDIAGGINAGMKTCWLDHGDKQLPDTVKPDWQVPTLTALHALLL
ncbi:pyrimidine 5'-nucleotidase [Rosenbergiella australiborealis]|uniref:Pyrimidine 5'-nucleotidase n=1 Tax=Rosenbergiella australiborealis TaxID=1544696 RepID=A0ABS5T1B2_9GAMM|nr:pyrimidine 5'-nucleotidase [Rosenbergiella australiborealis]MBT0726116.1 pyrimidine 5'-nucleotidase [Rosenbergiella australiborealis]